MKQFPQRDEAIMAEYQADSVDGSQNPTGAASQTYGGSDGTTHEAREHEGGATGAAEMAGPQTYEADDVPADGKRINVSGRAEAKVVEAPEQDKPQGRTRASKK